MPRLQAEAALGELGQALEDDGRGLRLQRMDEEWQLVTAPELGSRLAAYAARQETRLTPAALEALAVVAYRQPCTRADIDRVRGVDSDYVVRSLLHRRLIVEVGRRDAPGRPILLGTTFTFLERFGLTSSGRPAAAHQRRRLPDGADRAGRRRRRGGVGRAGGCRLSASRRRSREPGWPRAAAPRR